MRIAIIFIISIVVCVSSTRTYSQQKHGLETYQYLRNSGKEPEIYSLNRVKQNSIRLTHELLKGGIWDEIFSNLVYVPAATYIAPYVNSDSPATKQMVTNKRQISVTPFYILNTEVTNKMYRFFLADSTGEEYKPHYNTDTSIADADLSSHTIEVRRGVQYTLSNYAELDDYPVVGITWKAALSFCKWLTRKAMQLVDYKSDERLLVSFRLPSEADYELAALMNIVDENATEEEMNKALSKQSLRSNKDSRVRYSQITNADASIPGKFVDGFYFTNPVKTFKKGKIGLYGMQGNAAEWMFDVYTPLRNSNYTAYKAAVNNYNSNYYLRVVKGGSWYDKSLYVKPFVRQKYYEIQGSERIGFRIVITDLQEIMKTHYPK